MTRRLYRDDALLLEFDAQVLSVEKHDSAWAVALDRTAFYPEGGGQPADHGTLDNIQVSDVQEAGDRVIHITAAPLPEGRMVHGIVDGYRRHDFMQQHTGQHVISAAFWKEASLVTLSVHMGADATTIDLDANELTREQLDMVMRRVDSVIAADLPLDAVEAEPADLPRFSLRKPPPVDGPVRLVRIGEFDCVGCCGLHLPSTGPVRLAVCTGWERIRGKVRTHWQIGDRAVADLRQRILIMSGLREQLATRDKELLAAVKRQSEENTELRGRLLRQERRWADFLVHNMLNAAETSSGDKMVARILEGESPDVEKTVVKALLATEHCAFALVNVSPDRLTWTLGIPPEISVDFKELKQKHLDPLGARGGGRPPLWQGSAPQDTSPTDLLTALEQILQSVL